MNLIWLMVFFNVHTATLTGAVEFSSKETCEAAAIQIVNATTVAQSGGIVRKPFCIQVKK